MNKVLKFFAAAPGAIRGTVNVSELVRAGVVGVVTGGGVAGGIQAIAQDLPAIVVHSADLPLAAAALAFGVEVYRRLSHGATVETR